MKTQYLHILIQHQYKHGHTRKYAVLCLFKVISMRRAIYVGRNFVHARQGVQHTQIGFGTGQSGGMQVEFALDFGEFHVIEAFALHAGHIQDICPFRRTFQIGQYLPFCADFVQFFGNVFGHGQAGRRYKRKFAAEAF